MGFGWGSVGWGGERRSAARCLRANAAHRSTEGVVRQVIGWAAAVERAAAWKRDRGARAPSTCPIGGIWFVVAVLQALNDRR